MKRRKSFGFLAMGDDDASKKKELRAKIQALKKSVPKGDKKKKKEVQAEIAMLEAELEQLTIKEDEVVPVPELGFGYKETTEKKPNRQQMRKLKKEAEMQGMVARMKRALSSKSLTMLPIYGLRPGGARD